MNKVLKWQQKIIDRSSKYNNRELYSYYIESIQNNSGYYVDYRTNWKEIYLSELMQERLGKWLDG